MCEFDITLLSGSPHSLDAPFKCTDGRAEHYLEERSRELAAASGRCPFVKPNARKGE